MGNKKSKASISNHVAYSGDVPNIVITTPTPLTSPESPKPFAPPPSPVNNYYYPEQAPHSAPPPTPRATSTTDISRTHETMFVSGTPPLDAPPDRPPPPPPSDDDEPPSRQKSPFPSLPDTPIPVATPRTGLPTIKRNIVYAKDKIAQYEQSMNTTDRKKENGHIHDETSKYYSIKDAKPSELPTKFKPFKPTPFSASSTVSTTASSKVSQDLRYIDEDAYTNNLLRLDDYPIYNPVTDYSFKSGTTFHQGAFPIDSNRTNIGICGRQGSGKSSLINALRGLIDGEPQAAGRNPCDVMEPFRFLEDSLQSIVLWEIPYPKTFTTVVDVYDRNMGFDRLYDANKLHTFKHLYILIPDGAAHEDDIAFAKIVHSRRTNLTFLSTKSDGDLDADCRESGRQIDELLKKEYRQRAIDIFIKSLQTRAQILTLIDVYFISCSVVRNVLCGTTGYMHYKIDENLLLEDLGLKAGCHYQLESKRRRDKEQDGTARRYDQTREMFPKRPDNLRGVQSSSMKGHAPNTIQKSTMLVDAGFEILYGTDDRVFGNMEPNTSVRRAGKTTFNYGFIGGNGVGKSTMINAMRGMNSKHPLAAGKSRVKAGSCERFEFEDDLLKYNVTLWELHYPKKINSFFEFIDRHNIANFTAIFVLVDGYPTDEDLSFSKIAHRRNASVIFLSSKSDKKLSNRSRSDEIPVCDLLKQRFVDKGLARFDKVLAAYAPELCGRVHAFFVSAPVFLALRIGDARGLQFILHERAVFDFLKQKRIIADLLDSPGDLKEGLYANVNTDTAGVDIIQN